MWYFVYITPHSNQIWGFHVLDILSCGGLFRVIWDEIFDYSALGVQPPGDRQLLLALELQPAGEKDISTCWGRVGGLITRGQKEPIRWVRAVVPSEWEKALVWAGGPAQSHSDLVRKSWFWQQELISIDASKTQRKRGSDFPLPL